MAHWTEQVGLPSSNQKPSEMLPAHQVVKSKNPRGKGEACGTRTSEVVILSSCPSWVALEWRTPQGSKVFSSTVRQDGRYTLEGELAGIVNTPKQNAGQTIYCRSSK